eukprot:1631844-Alexandrium_andersonii.AAC.1
MTRPLAWKPHCLGTCALARHLPPPLPWISARSRWPISAISGLRTTARDARSAHWTPFASGAGGRS